MFVSDKVVFLELHKTGCTHIRNLLKEIVGGEFVGKHNRAGADLFDGRRLFLGSVRSPWDWYISLWAYGCDGKGSIFESVVTSGVKVKGLGWGSDPAQALRSLIGSHPRRNAKKWRRTYENVDDAAAFREWLHMMHDPEYWSDFGEGYAQSPMNSIAGLFTYRYVNLFCRNNRFTPNCTFAELLEEEKASCFIDHFVRNENLEEDLFMALERSRIQISSETKRNVLSRSRTNTSSRKRGADYYYDTETERLIADRERLLVQKFGYLAPADSAVVVPA